MFHFVYNCTVWEECTETRIYVVTMHQNTVNKVSWCPPTVELLPTPVKVMNMAFV